MIRVLGASALAVCALAVPALAQEGACGQPAALTQRLDAAVAPGFADLSLLLRPQRSEPAYVEFRVDAPTDVTFETMARSNDAALALFDAQGRTVTWDDDGAGDLDARIGASLQPGAYCVQMRLVGAEPVADPLVVLIGTEGLPPDPAHAAVEEVTALCADPARTPLLPEAPGSVEGLFDAANQIRSYRLSLKDPAILRIDAASASVDTTLSLHDMSGALLFENDDHDEMPDSGSRIEEPLEPADYCVVVRPFSASEGAFTLSLSSDSDPEGPVEDLGRLGDEMLESRSLLQDRTLRARFETTEEGTVIVEGVSMNGGISLRLLDANGAEVEATSSTEAYAAGTIIRDLAPGLYQIELTDDAAVAGLRVRQITVRRE